jgi:hypothetical protein
VKTWSMDESAEMLAQSVTDELTALESKVGFM